MNVSDLFPKTIPTRLSNGVRARADGKGDLWGLLHRTELDNENHKFYMNDFDGLIGQLGFVVNGQERMFCEYCIADSKPHMPSKKQFATVALFDRKKSVNALDVSAVSRAYYCDVCRKLGQAQVRPPKFFYVIGLKSPWEMSEVCITTEQITSTSIVHDGDWMQFWRASGLIELRELLNQSLWLAQ